MERHHQSSDLIQFQSSDFKVPKLTDNRYPRDTEKHPHPHPAALKTSKLLQIERKLNLTLTEK
ncbi:MAG: hypothetical protein QOI89_3579, partial [Solirubrobacteraceae bacterium]|nr:hypothetical protein [Solirubrobacteraceae bacterium]